MNKILTIKLGGSLLYDDQLRIKFNVIIELKSLIQDLIESGDQINLVVGGGKISRHYVKQLKNTMSNAHLDHLSILLTRINLFIVQQTLSDFSSCLVMNYDELITPSMMSLRVIGGMYPGQSTNGTAALVAEITNSCVLINLFEYDGIHDIDPKNNSSNKDPKLLHEITYQELSDMISKFKQSPGHYELFDHNALNIVKRSNIPVVFLNGNHLDSVRTYLQGKSIGTKVIPDKPTRGR